MNENAQTLLAIMQQGEELIAKLGEKLFQNYLYGMFRIHSNIDIMFLDHE